MNTKPLSFVPIALMLAWLAFVQPATALRVEVHPTVNTAPVGETVSVRVKYDPESNVALGGAWHVFFDPEALAYDGHVYGRLGDAMFQREPDVLAGRLEWFTVGDFRGLPLRGILVTVRFRVLREGAHVIQVREAHGIGPTWIDATDFSSFLQPKFRDGLVLTSDGVYPLLELPRVVETLPTRIGARSLTEIPIRNDGSGPLEIAEVTMSVSGSGGSDELVLEYDACSGQTLAAGADCALRLAHTPTRLLGPRHRFGELRVTSSDLLTPVARARIRARIASPQLDYDITDFFDGALQPPFLRQIVSVTNRGQWTAEIDDVLMIDNDPPETMRVIRDQCSGVTVEPNADCTFTVQFVPREPGRTFAWIGLRYNDGLFIDRVRFHGYTPTGIAEIVADGPLEFDMSVGDRVTRRLSLHNRGSALLTLTSSGPPSNDYVTVLATDCPGATLAPAEHCVADILVRAGEEGLITWGWHQFTDSHVASSVSIRLIVDVRAPRVR